MNQSVPIHARLDPRWIDCSNLRRAAVPPHFYPWLVDETSLTAGIKRACGHGCFKVRLLTQQWGRPLPSEAELLGMRIRGTALIREVELLCDQHPWVFARTLIPASSLRGSAKRLAHLGTKPLGAVLFADPRVRRGTRQVARLLPRHPLYTAAIGRLGQRPDEIWGRRSLFYLSRHPLLVNEIFLPAIPSREQ